MASQRRGSLAVGLGLAVLVIWLAGAATWAAPDAIGTIPQSSAAPEPTASAADWTDCRACHPQAGADLPQLDAFRPESLGAGIRSCRDCHQPGELFGLVSDWTHPVRPPAQHLDCTFCHEAVAHDAADPAPLPLGDYDAAACYECHREIGFNLGQMYSHGRYLNVHCRDCHPPHEPLQAALPPQLVPGELRNSWLSSHDWRRSNSACLDCHTSISITMSLTEGFVTLNALNYHQVHVIGGNVLCVECHDPHGSYRRAMLRDRLITGEYFFYTDLIDGASCSVVCHGINHADWPYINRVY
ncbi:hypothetical protein JW859_13910 [bacterium]|nr:hypothetical protein [bacterium]